MSFLFFSFWTCSALPSCLHATCLRNLHYIVNTTFYYLLVIFVSFNYSNRSPVLSISAWVLVSLFLLSVYAVGSKPQFDQVLLPVGLCRRFCLHYIFSAAGCRSVAMYSIRLLFRSRGLYQSFATARRWISVSTTYFYATIHDKFFPSHPVYSNDHQPLAYESTF